MASVAFVFVREDASEVEALADAFDRAGFSVAGAAGDSDTLDVVVWSRAALRSAAFRSAAERALRRHDVVIASLIAPPDSARVYGAALVDLSGWDGLDDEALGTLIDAANAIASPARPNVIALPGLAYVDAEFTEPPSRRPISESARRSWEAPIPTDMLRPVRDEPSAPKQGIASPRRDFRRLGSRQHGRAPAALAFIGSALIGVGVAFAALQPAPAPPRASHVEAVARPAAAQPAAAQAAAAEPAAAQAAASGVSLSSAAADTAGLEDYAPLEPGGLFDPAPQRGHPGFEPPSAPVHRAAYARTGR